MSKKITSFLMLLLTIFIVTPAMAQNDELNFGGTHISAGETVGTFEPNTWYLVYEKRGYNGYTGGYMSDAGEGKEVYKSEGVGAVPEKSKVSEKAAHIARFLPSDEEGGYYIQFGTGRYMVHPANTSSNGQSFTTSSSFEKAGMFNIYNINGEDGKFGMNIWNMGKRIDNNGSGRNVTTWEAGEITATTGNNVWNFYEIEWENPTEIEVALAGLDEVFNEYEKYAADGYFTTGENPGDFSEEAVQAFIDAINAADRNSPFFSDPDDVEEIKALGDSIVAKYNAIWPTLVPMTLEEGYYYIRAAMEYTKTVTDEETGEETTTHPEKYLRAFLEGSTYKAVWGTPEDLESDGTALWYVKPTQDGRYDIMNAGYEARFDTIVTSAAATLSVASTKEMTITPVYTDEMGVTYVNLNVYPQKTNGAFCIHQGGHSNGAGEGGNIVGWYGTFDRENKAPKASEWFFDPVDAEDAAAILEAFAPNKDREAMLEKYDSIMTNAQEKLELAIDLQHVKLIQSVDQLSSPYTEQTEGSLANLLDGNTGTFWHSQWSDGAGNSVAAEVGTHYLQVEMPENFEGGDIYATFTRRNNSGNQITEWGVYGTNDSEATKENCELLYTWETPFNSQTESLTSEQFATNNYHYLRFYGNNMKPTANGFWHMAEFQLILDQANPNAQFANMGEVGTNLQNVVNEQKDVERDDITEEMYNTLKAAYDAFLTKYVDPTILRDTLAAHKNLAENIENIVKVGTAPGQWTNADAGTAFEDLYNEAAAYDQAGKYTAEQSADYARRLNADAKTLYTLANGIKEGKWYRLQFPTEDMFTAYGWDKVAGNAQVSGGETTSTALFGKYAGLSHCFEYKVLINEKEVSKYEIEPISADTAGVGHNLYFIDPAYLTTDEQQDLTKFRFVAVGDSAYMLQNKATGLFIRANGTSGAVTLSLQPSLFNVSAVGYGACFIASRGLKGENQNYLHAQVLQNMLVTYNANASVDHQRCSLIIEEAEDVAGDFDGSVVNLMMKPGEVRGICFPMDVTLNEDPNAAMWGVASVEDNKVTLAKVEGQKAIAGRPVIIVNGDTALYQAADAPVAVKVKHNYTISALEPQTSGILRGTYNATTVGDSVIVMSGNKFVVTNADTSVGRNSAYIVSENGFDPKAELEIVLDGNAQDGIQTALVKVSKAGAVYTIDGRLVSRHATLNELSRFGRGTYILNGVKIVVK